MQQETLRLAVDESHHSSFGIPMALFWAHIQPYLVPRGTKERNPIISTANQTLGLTPDRN
ncbi:uncharacterized protein G6M90_00g033900 [Metarhizium brunneum]|uniref:Uncharacterized protein n=1 Tax=Metarhizium brunneum TaxID=500148 RepID=A0A7D5YVH0_9HYPO|nr:hypothetical protein G6M90_00g033900 [Metarhizium brunneum]